MARLNNYWFEFAGVSSVTNGLKLLELPKRPRPALRVSDDNPILGRDGAFWQSEDAYEDFELTLRGEVTPTPNLVDIHAVQMYSSEVCGASWAANDSEGITVTSVTSAAWQNVTYELVSLLPFDLAGKNLIVRCGGFIATGTGAGGIIAIWAQSPSNPAWHQTIYETYGVVDGATATIPYGLPNDAILVMRLFVSRGDPAEVGATVKYTNISIEVSDPLPMLNKKIDIISAWLTGQGMLRFSDAPTRAYKARAIKSYDYERTSGCLTRHVFEVTFSCHPCQYVYPIPSGEITNGATILNPGTRYAAPIITIVGSGDITLTIGEQTLVITGLASQITLDMENRVAYNGSTNLGYSVSGDRIILIQPGNNVVSWTGSVTSVTITTNWRYL